LIPASTTKCAPWRSRLIIVRCGRSLIS